ncbi:MAG: hypothetical protein MJ103_07585 [Saccharofermentans sp.]|nr:hypothetical protein [Saccharofermentans sp.]
MEKGKKSRTVLNVLFTISLYFLQVYIILSLALYDNFSYSVQQYLVPLILVFAVIPTILGIINIVKTRGVARKVEASISTRLFIEKIALIPWFLTNFIMWFVMFTGFINPLLMVGIPIVIGVGVTVTYGYFLIINLKTVVYVFARFKKKQQKISGIVLLAVIFQFIYILDLAGDVLLLIESKKNPF